MTFKSLASSSSGNAYIVTDATSGGVTRILLECGLRFKELEIKLEHRLSDITACLITHEHADHSRSHRELTERGIPVYASAGTAEALGNTLIGIVEEKRVFTVGSFKVLPFGVFHDAVQPFGFLLRGSDGETLLFATDTRSIPCTVDGLNIAAVECNHDRRILEGDNIEPWIKRAANAHMSIETLCDYLDKLDRSRLRQIYLLHMSDRHADEGAYVKRIQERYGIPTVACIK